MMQAELRKLFYDAVGVFAKSEGLPLSVPNRAFDPPSGPRAQYIQAQTLPVRPIVEFVDGVSRYRFVLQLNLFAKPDMGELSSLRIADKLHKKVFPIHHELKGVEHTFKVIVPVFPAPPVPEDGWLSIPVTFTVQTIH